MADGAFRTASSKRLGPRLPNGDFFGGRHLRRLAAARARQQRALLKMARANLRRLRAAHKAAVRAAKVRVPRAPRPKKPKRPKNTKPRRQRTGRSSKGRLHRGGRTVFRASYSGWLVRAFVKAARKMLRKRKSDFRNHGFTRSGRGGYTGRAGMR